ncbi:MAG: putative glycoside hydrolase [Paludibacteraceae bacterium]|nr:putative glycoside hydrolase [Paludibacteraceae bacterium]
MRIKSCLFFFVPFILMGCVTGESPKKPLKEDVVVTDTVEKITDDTTSVQGDSVVSLQKDSTRHVVSRVTRPAPIQKGALLIPQVKVKGIYVTGPTAGTKRMKEMVELVTSTEMNTIVLDIKNDGGDLTYKIQDTMAQKVGACKRYVRDMPALLKELHEQGIYVIGRIVCFKDPYLAKYDKDLALCKPDGSSVTDGKGLPWVNPYKEKVWDYICSIAEQATKDGFDEIQFDYVRFPIGTDANKADYGVDLATYSKEQCLSDFFAYVQKRLHAKGIVYGADLFGTVIGSDIDRGRTGQNYAELATMTDALCPMIYPSHYGKRTFGIPVPDANPYQTIYKACLLSQEQLKRPDSATIAVVRPWLQCFSAPWVEGHISYGSKQIKDQIQAVYDAGYDEWILWNASNHYSQVKAALSKEPVKSVVPVKKDTTKKVDTLVQKIKAEKDTIVTKEKDTVNKVKRDTIVP